MAIILQTIMKKSKLYHIDEFGIINYRTRFLILFGFILMTLLSLTVGYIAYLAEYGEPNSTIKSYGDAVWLMVTSATTIGFGGVLAVTPIGRLMVVLIFIFGVGIMGAMGTLIASKLLGFSDTNVKNRELRKQNAEILRQNEVSLKMLSQLNETVRKLEERIEKIDIKNYNNKD